MIDSKDTSEITACEHPSNMWRIRVANPHCGVCGMEFQRVAPKIQLVVPDDGAAQ